MPSNTIIMLLQNIERKEVGGELQQFLNRKRVGLHKFLKGRTSLPLWLCGDWQI